MFSQKLEQKQEKVFFIFFQKKSIFLKNGFYHISALKIAIKLQISGGKSSKFDLSPPEICNFIAMFFQKLEQKYEDTKKVDFSKKIDFLEKLFLSYLSSENCYKITDFGR